MLYTNGLTIEIGKDSSVEREGKYLPAASEKREDSSSWSRRYFLNDFRDARYWDVRGTIIIVSHSWTQAKT